MSVIAFIPVRGGSKSIPLKNIKNFCGKPLVYWTAKAANDSKSVDQVIIATDNCEIKSVVQSFNLPKISVYDRDALNAQDTSTTESVMLEYINKSELKSQDIFILIQATSPLTTAHDIDGAVALFSAEKADSLLSCSRSKRFFWNEDGTPINYDFSNRPRRQDFKGTLMENGAIYISSVQAIKASNCRLSGKIAIYEMPEYCGVELDEPLDWSIAENTMSRHVLENIYQYSSVNEVSNILENDKIEIKICKEKVRTILDKQVKLGKYNRLDIIVRLLAIENEHGLNDYGWNLYIKMQNMRFGNGKNVSEEYVKKFKELIYSWEQNGYQRNSAILIDKNLNLVDGSHRMAMALYYNLEEITCAIARENYNIMPYGIEWFQTNGFTKEEIEYILQKAEKFIEHEAIISSNIKNFVRNFVIKKYIKYLKGNKQIFGRGTLYQSFPMLNLDGQRHTDIRINTYGLTKLLTKDMDVLDIGSNIGFFDMTISKYADTILGIEYNKTLVEIAVKTSEMLKINNVSFVCDDFIKWYSKNNRKYHFILSLAVHYWLKISPEDYVKIIANLLYVGGYVLIESQNIETVDKEFDKFINEFTCHNFEKCSEGEIMDDGIIRRKWLILKYRPLMEH